MLGAEIAAELHLIRGLVELLVLERDRERVHLTEAVGECQLRGDCGIEPTAQIGRDLDVTAEAQTNGIREDLARALDGFGRRSVEAALLRPVERRVRRERPTLAAD